MEEIKLSGEKQVATGAHRDNMILHGKAVAKTMEVCWQLCFQIGVACIASPYQYRLSHQELRVPKEFSTLGYIASHTSATYQCNTLFVLTLYPDGLFHLPECTGQ